MATTTPNFGWPVPTSTDLVKDGATAIEALGDGIDASLLDLKGGTTGQVLAKASNTDLDYSWVTTDDANAIQNSIVDAKADLITATAADTPARLAVGANDYFLQAASGQATGLQWGGTYTAYTPVFDGGSGYVLGNGTIVGRYIKIGKMVNVNIQFTIGSTTVMPASFTNVTLPFTGLTGVPAIGTAYYYDLSADVFYGGPVGWFSPSSGTKLLLFVQSTNANSSLVTSTTPFTWATGDLISLSMTYEAA
jgi:hypothetical protein